MWSGGGGGGGGADKREKYCDIDNTMQIFREIPFFRATKPHLNNSGTVKKKKKKREWK